MKIKAQATFVLFILLLQGCVAEPEYHPTRPDDYILPGGNQRLSKSEAETILVEKYFNTQLKGSLDAPILAIKINLPPYPKSLKELEYVPIMQLTIGFTVNKKGKVERATIISAPTNTELDSLCLDAVKHWLFEPSFKDGKPAKFKLAYTFRFHLKN